MWTPFLYNTSQFFVTMFQVLDNEDDWTESEFQHLRKKFSLEKSQVKMKVFLIVLKSGTWCLTLSAKGNWSQLNHGTWEAFVQAVHNFLGSHGAEDPFDLVDKMLKAYRLMSVTMSLKIHFLQSHLDFFPRNLSDMSNCDIAMKNWYQVKFKPSMTADYCWFLQRETDVQYKHKSKCLKHFWERWPCLS